MDNLYKTKIPIFGGILTVVFTDDMQATGKELKIDFDAEFNNYLGLAYKRTHKREFIVFLKTEQATNYSTVAHESVHIANFILKDIGAKVRTTDDEVQAYLVGWVAGQVQKAFDKWIS